MKICFSFFLFFLFLFNPSFSQTNVSFSLNQNWSFKYKDQWYNTSVPNSIHTDLLRHQLIEDPFYRDNETKQQWIGEQDWELKKEFNVDTALLNKQIVELLFKGLDTYADVFLNDSLILKADNMFQEWKISCKQNLHLEKNELKIIFHSATKKAKELYENYPYKKLPGEERVMARKAQYHFGWDFAPRFITCGIWKDVELIGWDYFNIENVFFTTLSIYDSIATLIGRVEVGASKDSPFIINVIDKVSNQSVGSSFTRLKAGRNLILLRLKIKNPKLWWCNGSGKQNFYTLITKGTTDSQNWTTEERRIAIRKIQLIQEEDKVGSSFYFKLNDKLIFMKGANYVPQDVFLNRVTDEKYELLLKKVKTANMNMLRVWGGGIYEKEKFYDLCDEYGILVWQDFMFACGMYPVDSLFLKNVKEEAEQQVKRLSNHPCIALWCGNNEVSEGWHRWGWQNDYSENERKKIWHGYQKLFNDILPGAVKKYSNTFYYETSPMYGRGDERHNKEGDAHNWFVWHDGEPFENYEQKVPRFMSEFGFQSYPALKTIEKFALPSDQNLESDVMKVHQKHSRGNEIIKTYMQRQYGKLPANFAEFIEISQLLQMQGVTQGIRAHLNASPYCTGSLIWQLNDCWPAASWSMIDYYGNKKKLYYGVKKEFKE